VAALFLPAQGESGADDLRDAWWVEKGAIQSFAKTGAHTAGRCRILLPVDPRMDYFLRDNARGVE